MQQCIAIGKQNRMNTYLKYGKHRVNVPLMEQKKKLILKEYHKK